MAINTGKVQILNKIFMIYWEWDTLPELENPEDNSPEYLLLQLYDDLKAEALSQYNFRSSIKYVNLECEEPDTNDDERYKYRAAVPEDFLKATGFWEDATRSCPIHNSVDIHNFIAKTNCPTFTMAYVSKTIEEDKLDQWVIDYLSIYIASKASDIGGCSAEKKQYLMQEAILQRNLCANRDMEMAHQDDMASLNQFLEDFA